MAKFVFGMSQSLDGYVDDAAGGLVLPPPGVALFRHFTDWVGSLAGSLYGRRIYELMRYWDEDRPEWGAAERDFAVAWRAQPKWVVSRSLQSVGANASLVGDDVEAFVRRLKAEVKGEIEVAGPDLAGQLTKLGLIDEYRLYFRPVVLGGGKPFFAGAPPRLRLISTDPVGEDTVRLAYVPA
jgi:dihydrofolate reductase